MTIATIHKKQIWKHLGGTRGNVSQWSKLTAKLPKSLGNINICTNFHGRVGKIFQSWPKWYNHQQTYISVQSLTCLKMKTLKGSGFKIIFQLNQRLSFQYWRLWTSVYMASIYNVYKWHCAVIKDNIRRITLSWHVEPLDQLADSTHNPHFKPWPQVGRCISTW